MPGLTKDPVRVQRDGVQLEAIQKDLAAIRSCLIHAGLSDSREMAHRLQSVVDQFREWTAAGPVDRESVEEIQRQLTDLQPLFENAYALHSGWFQMMDAGAAGQYDGAGKRVEPAVASAPLDGALRG